MSKRILLAILLAASTNSFADTCPNIHDVKTKKVKDWQGYDSDDHTPLSKKRMARFLNKAHEFVLAEWSEKSNKRGAIRCYYRDQNGSDLDMYLSKANYIPENTKTWYEVSDAKQCAAGMKACQFISTNFGKKHLAQR